MTRVFACGLLGVVFAACAARAPSESKLPPTSCEGALPDYALVVKPILEKRCFACHTGNGAASEHDFSREASVVAQRRALASQVSSRSMPPPPRALPEDEASVLVRWARCVHVETAASGAP